MTGALLATDPALVAAASPEEQARAHAILWDILPVSARADGLLNDARLSGNPAPMPLADDPRPDARHLARGRPLRHHRRGPLHRRRGPGGGLVTWPTGGHI